MFPQTSLKIVQTSRGYRYIVSRPVNAPIEKAWKIISQPDQWYEWGPLITDIQYAHDSVRKDQSGKIQLLNLFWIPFTIQQRTNHFWTWKIGGFLPPADGHRVEKVSHKQSSVIFELPLWAFWYIPTCGWALRNIDQIISG